MGLLKLNGVSEKAVRDFLLEVKKQEIDLHGISIYRNGTILFEDYAAPFSGDTYHRMYSSGKFIVGLAVMKAVEEGYFSLDDRVVSFFSEDLPENLAPEYDRLLVRHMLTMSCGHWHDTMFSMRSKENWIRAFFEEKMDAEPGERFFYDCGVPYICQKIVETRTGMGFIDYLNSRIFDQMDVHLFADRTPKGEDDPSGLNIRIRDFFKLAVLLLNEGIWQGKQLLSAEACKEMGKCHLSSLQVDGIPNVNRDTTFGYGYFLWRNSVGGFRMDGGKGQYGIVLPEYNMAVSMMSFEEDQGLLLDNLWDTIFRNLYDGMAPAWTGCEELPKLSAFPLWNEEICDTSLVDKTSYVFTPNDLGIDEVSFSFGKDSISAVFIQNGKEIILTGGTKGEPCRNERYIGLPEQNEFMYHVSGNDDEAYYTVARFAVAENFMRNRELVFMTRSLKESHYHKLVFSFANDALSMQVIHGSWANVILRDRLEIMPHIIRPILLNARLKDEEGKTE